MAFEEERQAFAAYAKALNAGALKSQAMTLRQHVHNLETDVMTMASEALTWIAQSHDQEEVFIHG